MTKNKKRDYIADKRRVAGSKEELRTILIVCNGKETEPRYFNDLRQYNALRSVKVVVDPKPIDSLSLVNYAIKRRGNERTRDFDEVWCILDVENPINNTTLPTAIQTARKAKISLAISNPAIEYWFLLHFTESDKPYHNAPSLIRELKRHMANYEKNVSIYPRIQGQTRIAIDRAEKLLNKHTDYNGTNHPNPCTTIYQLVKVLIEIKN